MIVSINEKFAKIFMQFSVKNRIKFVDFYMNKNYTIDSTFKEG